MAKSDYKRVESPSFGDRVLFKYGHGFVPCNFGPCVVVWPGRKLVRVRFPGGVRDVRADKLFVRVS